MTGKSWLALALALEGMVGASCAGPTASQRDTDEGSHKQTDEPWKGNPEKEQRSGTKKSDPDKWQETNTH